MAPEKYAQPESHRPATARTPGGQLCEELQAAVDQAGDHRRLLEQVKQTAQELLTDEELRPTARKSKQPRTAFVEPSPVDQPAVDLRLSFAYSWRHQEGHDVLPLTKRQREILDYLQDFIQRHGYAPSLEEIGRRFGLSSLATVHKHLTNLQEKGFIKRAWNRSRSVEMIPTTTAGRSVELPLLGYVAAGVPIEAVASARRLPCPKIWWAGATPTCCACAATR